MAPTADPPIAGSLDVVWNSGTSRDEPAIQVHAYAENTIILRQSKATSFEAPFLYLLFGQDRALLLDTGATADPAAFPLRATVDWLIEQWLAARPRDGYELVVAHSHGHGDHVAADGQFADRPATTVIAREADAVRSFFGLTDGWPEQTAAFDLGGRALEIIPSPGHHPAAITVYDPSTGILLTGDTVLPGRLLVFDAAAFRSTMDRLVAFAARRPVTHVLGCHVEMTRRPGRDFPIGATRQPDERGLAMTSRQLTAVRDAAAAMTGRRGVRRFDDFILYHEPRPWDLRRLLARGRMHQAWTRAFHR
ncbi:MBL fold metallo-hydrolase [Catellatospora paridis]|uniref:MBL fold metallo-hydrolase n=1 Tax=Catellatospora paridis TaxID=1617086 RepID=UPI0012D3D39F|nr:MBL fold metallo-hydrolase [Catellatospora paridis]